MVIYLPRSFYIHDFTLQIESQWCGWVSCPTSTSLDIRGVQFHCLIGTGSAPTVGKTWCLVDVDNHQLQIQQNMSYQVINNISTICNIYIYKYVYILYIYMYILMSSSHIHTYNIYIYITTRLQEKCLWLWVKTID